MEMKTVPRNLILFTLLHGYLLNSILHLPTIHGYNSFATPVLGCQKIIIITSSRQSTVPASVSGLLTAYDFASGIRTILIELQATDQGTSSKLDALNLLHGHTKSKFTQTALSKCFKKNTNSTHPHTPTATLKRQSSHHFSLQQKHILQLLTLPLNIT